MDNGQIYGSPANRNLLNKTTHEGQSSQPNTMELEYYDMSKDKTLLIFNHEDFRIRAPHFWCGGETLPPRYGTNHDKETLTNLFTDLQFEVTDHNNLSRDEILRVVDDFVQLDHRNTSCVVVVFLTHGSNNGVLYAYDGPYNISEIMSKFENINLLQIPKMFLIQACRGAITNDGHYVQLDGGSARFKIPTHSDFVVLHSTIEGYVSHRRRDGSWMIQIFCEVLRNYHGSLDILHIITLVNKRMSGRVSRSRDSAGDNKKQISETRYTLTKLLKF